MDEIYTAKNKQFPAKYSVELEHLTFYANSVQELYDLEIESRENAIKAFEKFLKPNKDYLRSFQNLLKYRSFNEPLQWVYTVDRGGELGSISSEDLSEIIELGP